MRVTLRKCMLRTGKISLYLDHYPPIIHPESGKITRWEYLNMFMYNPPRDEVEKRHNKDIETLARSIAANRQLDRLAGKFGIKRSSQFDDFLPFYEKQMDKWINGLAIQIPMVVGLHPIKPLFNFVRVNATLVISLHNLLMNTKSF